MILIFYCYIADEKIKLFYRDVAFVRLQTMPDPRVRSARRGSEVAPVCSDLHVARLHQTRCLRTIRACKRALLTRLYL